jgi:hypothetical protein
MEQPKGTDTAAFARVWSRVNASNGTSQVEVKGESQPQAGDTATFLRENIRRALTQWRTCAVWVGNHPAAPLLRQLAGEKAQSARKLSAALFLQTGERYFPSREVTPLEAHSWQEGLRQVYLSTVEAEGAYRRAALESRDSQQMAQWQSLAEEAQSQARRIQEALAHWGV